MAGEQTANEAIFDAQVRHQIGLQRLSTAIVRKIIALLNRADAELVAKLLTFEGDPSRGEWTKARLEAMLAAIREIVQESYNAINPAIRQEMMDLAQYEVEFQAKTIASAIPIKWDIVTPPLEQLVSAVTSRPFQGAILSEWVKHLGDEQARRLRNEIRMGFVQGETIDQIVKRVRGNPTGKRSAYWVGPKGELSQFEVAGWQKRFYQSFSGGVLDIGRRQAEAVVRTAVNHTATASRELLYSANSDLIKGVRWVSTLDGRTTEICIARDGQVYDLNKGPRPPAHWNCRSTTAPVLKSWRELGIDEDDAPLGTRAAMDGQVPADMTYGEWLKRQPREFVEDVLGKTKAALFLDGNLTVDRFVHDNGRPVTLAELKAREAQAFDRAGIDGTRVGRGEREARERAFRDLLGQQKYERVRAGAEQAISASSETRKRLSQAELVAIHGYTTETTVGRLSDFQVINGALRRGDKAELDRLAPYINTVKAGLEKLPYHRGFVERKTTLPSSVVNAMEEGSRFSDPAFLSTSVNRSGFTGDHRLIISSRVGRRIDGYSRFPDEDEVLFPPGHKFKITKVWREGREVTIYMKDEEG